MSGTVSRAADLADVEGYFDTGQSVFITGTAGAFRREVGTIHWILEGHACAVLALVRTVTEGVVLTSFAVE